MMRKKQAKSQYINKQFFQNGKQKQFNDFSIYCQHHNSVYMYN